MAQHYGARVVYYGKLMSRDQVLADKLRFIRAYPYRTYEIAPGSTSTTCSEPDICVARAVLLWERRSASGEASSGASRLRLELSRREGGKIVRESANVLRR